MTATDTLNANDVDVVEIPVDLIDPDPENTGRSDPDETLIESVRERGVETPIFVRVVDGGRYELIAGERRWRASVAAERATVPAIVKVPVDEADRIEMQGVENLHRKDLHPLDEGRLFSRLRLAGRTQQQIADRFADGQQPYVSKRMNLHLRLDDRAKELFRDGRLNVKEAEALAQIHDNTTLIAELLDAAAKSEPGQHQHFQSWKIEEELRRQQREKAIAKARKQLEKDGVRVVTDDEWNGDTVHALGTWSIWDVAIDAEAHAAEPCHVGHVDQRGEIKYGCSARDRHRPAGESTVKADNLTDLGVIDPDDPDVVLDDEGEVIDTENPRTPGEPGETWEQRNEREVKARQEREAEAQAVIDARRAFVRQLLTGGGHDRTAAADFVASVLIDITAQDFTEGQFASLALELIGSEDDITDLDRMLDDGYAETGHGPAFRRLTAGRLDVGAVAAACAIAEEPINSPYQLTGHHNRAAWGNDTTLAYLTFLRAHGWTPSALEEDAIAAGQAERAKREPHAFAPHPDTTGAPSEICSVCNRKVETGPHPVQEGEHRRGVDDDGQATCSCGWTSEKLAKKNSAGRAQAYDGHVAVERAAANALIPLDLETTTYRFLWTQGTTDEPVHLLINAQDESGNIKMVPIDAPLCVGAPPERRGKSLGDEAANDADRKGAIPRLLAEHVLERTARKPEIAAVAKLIKDPETFSVTRADVAAVLAPFVDADKAATGGPPPGEPVTTTNTAGHQLPDETVKNADDGMPWTYALTRTRMEALKVLAFADAVGLEGARSSTYTTYKFEGADAELLVIAQSVKWLVEQGLAQYVTEAGPRAVLQITEEGKRVATEEQLLDGIDLPEPATSTPDVVEAPTADVTELELVKERPAAGDAPEVDPLPAVVAGFVAARDALEATKTANKKDRPTATGRYEDARAALASTLVLRHPNREQLAGGLQAIVDAIAEDRPDVGSDLVELLEQGGAIEDTATDLLRLEKRPATRVAGLLRHVYVEDLLDVVEDLGGIDLGAVSDWQATNWPDMHDVDDATAAEYFTAHRAEWGSDGARIVYLIERANAGVAWNHRPKLLMAIRSYLGAKTP